MARDPHWRLGARLDPGLERRLTGWLYRQILRDRRITLSELGARMGTTKQAVHQNLNNGGGPGFEATVYSLDEAITAITEDRGGVAQVCNIDGDSAREFQDLVTTELARRYATGAAE